MQSSTFQKNFFLLTVVLIHGLLSASANDQLSDTTSNRGVKIEGLTGTLSNLIKARIPSNILVGAYEISLENLIDDDIAAVFNCDSVISGYLAEAGDWATYEGLADEMSSTIESRFMYDDEYLNVNVFPEATDDSMHFNISVRRGMKVSVPVVFNASDSSFYTAFDTVCTLEFNADIDLFVNAGLVLKDSATNAISIRINTFTVELYSTPWDDFEYHECFDCDWDSIDSSALTEDSLQVIPFIINDIPFNATEVCFILYAKSFWYLSPTDASGVLEDEETAYILSFEQIEKGNFTWDEFHLSALESVIVMVPADESRDSLAVSENRAMFQYTVDDLFDGESLEQIWLQADIHIDREVTLRTRRYTHGR